MIDVSDLWKSYGNTAILKGLNLHIPAGQILVIMGRSGVGKSVLLRHIMGLEKPDRGDIAIDGVQITSLSQKALFERVMHFGMLFQGSALFDSMTVGENVAFYFTQHANIAKSVLAASVEQALHDVGLSGYQNKMPSQLSGGQRRRAALARLNIYKPKIMLFDEPTTGLDPITAMQINELIAKTHKELQSTSILVTHDVNSALHLGDLFAIHHEGKIQSVLTKEQFLQSDNPLIREFIQNSFINLTCDTP